MADGRINSLINKLTTAQLATYYSTLRLAIDDPAFSTDTPYVLVSDLFLGVKTDITNLQNGKANKSNVLLKDNTDEYTPTENYQPATKKMVDDIGMYVVSRARINSDGSIFAQKGITISSSRYATGVYLITHNIGSSSNYMVMANVKALTSNANTIKVGGIYNRENSFYVSFADDTTPNNTDFEFIIVKFNTAFNF